MAGSQISTSVTIINSLLGFQSISFDAGKLYSGSVPTIAAGSKVEIAGAFFTFSSEDTPQASTWTAVATESTAYITLTPSGTAGSQIVTSKWSTTIPMFSISKQGYYASTSSNIRYIAQAYKISATQAYPTVIYNHPFYEIDTNTKNLYTPARVVFRSNFSQSSVSITQGSVFTVLDTYYPRDLPYIEPMFPVFPLRGCAQTSDGDFVVFDSACRVSSTRFVIWAYDITSVGSIYIDIYSGLALAVFNSYSMGF